MQKEKDIQELCYYQKNIENINYGIGIDKHDKEGRVITAELENSYLVNVYVPNSGSDKKILSAGFLTGQKSGMLIF